MKTIKKSAMTSGVTTRFARRVGRAKNIAVCGLLGVLAGGCDALMQKPHCPELSSCGGVVPVGDWVLAPGHGSCSEDIYIPPADLRLQGGVILPPARSPATEPALYDWCDQLVTKAYDSQMGILRNDPNLYTPDIQIGSASVSYRMDNTYSAGLGRTGLFSLTFPSLCMREFGATDGNPAVDKNTQMPAGGPVNICKQLELPLAQDSHGGGAIPDVNCDVDPDKTDTGGCVCTFTAAELGGGAGTYLPYDDHTLLNLPGSDFPQKVTYCNTGSELQLTGGDGQYLFGALGLRTLDLVPAPKTP